MLNSLLILGSTNKKTEKLNYLFAILWICYMLLNSNFVSGTIFTLMNLIAFSVVFIIGKLIDGKYSNIIISIFSTLLWSIIIDIMCYFIMPQFVSSTGLFTYILNGILFNYKSVFVNILVISLINVLELVFKKVKFLNNEEKTINLILTQN